MECKLDFCDVLLVPQNSGINSRSEVSLESTFYFKNGRTLVCTPIVAANMDTVGTVSMAKAFKESKAMVALHKYHPVSEHSNHENTFLTVGLAVDDRDKVAKVFNAKDAFNLMIDAPNGYIPAMKSAIEYYRKTYPLAIICAGNVASPAGVKRLAGYGADIVKIGIGSGKLCNTRLKAGVGYPQFSLIVDCYSEMHYKFDPNDPTFSKYDKVYLMSDGGANTPGDIAKAFGAGADFVMLGSMLMGHTECDVPVNDNESMTCYGMSSDTAMNKYHGGVADYKTCEGRTVEIPFKGPVANTLKDIYGGLRSAGAYIGACKLSDFWRTAKFIQVQRQANH